MVYGAQHIHVEVVHIGYVDQVADVLREESAAITAAGIDILGSDAAVGSHTMAHHIGVGAHHLAEVGNLVHEADASGKHAGCRIFDHLGGLGIGEYHGVVAQQNGAVEAGKHLLGTLVLHADDDAVGFHEVLDGVALGEEVGVRCYIKLHLVGPLVHLFGNDVLDLLGSSSRHGGLEHKHRVSLDALGKIASNLLEGREVGTAVGVKFGVASAEHHIHIVEAPLIIGAEDESAVVHIVIHHSLKARFVDGKCAIHKAVYLLTVGVYTGDIHAQLREAGACDKCHISGSDNRYFHDC